MERRKFLVNSLVGIVVSNMPPAIAIAQSFLTSKIHPDLDEKLERRTYKRFLGIEKLADVMIIYKSPPDDEDVKALYKIGGQRMEFYNNVRAVRVGLPYDKIKDYAQRENVIRIIEDPVKD